MSYVTKVLSSEEKLLYVTGPHWIYIIEGIFWFAVLTAAGFFMEYAAQHYGTHSAFPFDIDLGFIRFNEYNTPIPWVFGFTGFLIFWPLFLKRFTTEVGLTNQRIIHKRGLIYIRIEQVDLDDIKEEHISHGWFGWWLGYGKVKLDCRFVEDFVLPAIYDPYRLIKMAHIASMKNPDLDFTDKDLKKKIKEIDKKSQEPNLSPKLLWLKNTIKLNFRDAA